MNYITLCQVPLYAKHKIVVSYPDAEKPETGPLPLVSGTLGAGGVV